MMSSSGPAALPPLLADYFTTEDRSQIASLFSPNASVHDEGQWHRGAAAVAAWLASVEERYHPRYQVNEVRREDDRTIVTFEVSGTFRGSPATLSQAFTFGPDALIKSIETL